MATTSLLRFATKKIYLASGLLFLVCSAASLGVHEVIRNAPDSLVTSIGNFVVREFAQPRITNAAVAGYLRPRALVLGKFFY